MNSPRVQFSSLPYELRLQIWLLTLEPRTLHLQIHKHAAPPCHLHSECMLRNNPCRYHDGVTSPIPNETVLVCFTASVFTGKQQLPCLKNLIDSLDLKCCTARPPPGPSALYICQESREVALQHYQLAFGGWAIDSDYYAKERQAFAEAGCLQKRIWVDLKRDTIFLTLEV
jgi:hypothetical protein